MNRLNYLMERYNTRDIEVLECRVPFNYKDIKLNELTDEEYISMIDRIEDIEHVEIYNSLKARGYVE